MHRVARCCRYVPHVIEPSIGVDRLMLAVLCSAYAEDEVGGETRSVLRFHPRLAPIKAAVLPLVKNKPELIAKAEAVYARLQRRYYVTYDAAGAIGRRYRRMDEVGSRAARGARIPGHSVLSAPLRPLHCACDRWGRPTASLLTSKPSTTTR